MKSLLNLRVRKSIKFKFIISVYLILFGLTVCFGQINATQTQSPQVIDDHLFVTKTLSVAKSPGSLNYVYNLGSKLFVNGRTSSGALGIGPWPANPDNYVFFGVGTLNQSNAGNYALLQSFQGSRKGNTILNSPVDIKFRINNRDEMILSNEGNFGIGTTTPGDKLTIVGDGMSIRSPGDDGEIKLETSSRDGFSTISSEKRLRLTSRGAVISLESQIGVVIGRDIVVPQAELDVNGEIALREVNVWDGSDDFDLTWNGLQISREGSSRRYKKDITPLQTNFQQILQLEPKQFKMKEGYGEPNKWIFGYIAEDVDGLGLKRLCIYDKENRPDGVKYKKIAIYVLEVVKDQQQRIEQLEESIQKMETLLSEINKPSAQVN